MAAAVTLKTPAGVAPPVAHYSHLAVIAPGARLLALAGQVGNRPDGGFPEAVEDQFAQAIDNILAIVASEGGDASAVARLTGYITERPADRTALQRVIRNAFGDTPPAMTLVTVAALFAPHVKAEIEALAAVS